MTFISHFDKLQIFPYLFPGFRNFHVLNLNCEKFKLYLQNTHKHAENDYGIFWGVTICVFGQECLTFYDVPPSSLMEEGSCLFYMGSRRFPSETEGEGGALLAWYDLFSFYIAKLPFK